jgi:hypothetical protein
MLNLEYPAWPMNANAFTNHDGVIHGAELRHSVNGHFNPKGVWFALGH